MESTRFGNGDVKITHIEIGQQAGVLVCAHETQCDPVRFLDKLREVGALDADQADLNFAMGLHGDFVFCLNTPTGATTLLDVVTQAARQVMPEERTTELTWGENNRGGRTHLEWHAPCGCAFHPSPFPHVHPCSDNHKRPDLHAKTKHQSESVEYFQWFIDVVPQWWKDATGEGSGATVDVSTGTVYVAGVRLASKGDYILRIDGKLWGCPRQVFEAIKL